MSTMWQSNSRSALGRGAASAASVQESTTLQYISFGLSGTKEKFRLDLIYDPVFMLSKKASQKKPPDTQVTKNNSSSTFIVSPNRCTHCLKQRTTFQTVEYCHFCGESLCKDCAKDFRKTRLFLQSQTQEKGKICKICDAKHVLREIYLP